MAAIIMGLRGGGNVQKFRRATMSGDDEGAEKSAVNPASNTEELTTPMPSENDCLFSGDIAKCPLYSDSPEWRPHFFGSFGRIAMQCSRASTQREYDTNITLTHILAGPGNLKEQD